MSLEMPDTPEQAGLVVEQVLDRARVHPPLVHQVEQDAGVDASRSACPSRRPSSGGEAHRARDALAGAQGAQARAVAEVAHDGPARGRARVVRGQHRGDVLVGQPVESVAAHAGVVQLGRDREALRDVRDWSSGTTCRSTRPAADRAGARAASEIGARLLGWCSGASGTSFFEHGDHVAVDPHRLGVIRPAVDHAVTDGLELAGASPLREGSRRRAPRRPRGRA